jgi:hypothetical protein
VQAEQDFWLEGGRALVAGPSVASGVMRGIRGRHAGETSARVEDGGAGQRPAPHAAVVLHRRRRLKAATQDRAMHLTDLGQRVGLIPAPLRLSALRSTMSSWLTRNLRSMTGILPTS